MANSAMSSLQIRLATHSDLARILQIEREAPTSAHWTEVDYENVFVSTSPQRVFLAAENIGGVEGFLVARCAHPSEWEIENVVVAATARRLGLGAALLKSFLERVHSKNPLIGEALVIHLEVRESNHAARGLYEKSGFTVDKRRRAYYRHPDEDAICYHLIFQQHKSNLS